MMPTSTTQPDSENSLPTSTPTGGISPDGRARIAEFSATFREAVREAQEESRRLGVPNVYEINGVTHYELPNGELTTEDPYPAMQAAKAEGEGKG